MGHSIIGELMQATALKIIYRQTFDSIPISPDRPIEVSLDNPLTFIQTHLGHVIGQLFGRICQRDKEL